MRTAVGVAFAVALVGAGCGERGSAPEGRGEPVPTSEVHGLQVDLPLPELARRSTLVVVAVVEADPRVERSGSASIDWVPVRVEETVRGTASGPVVRVGSYGGTAGSEVEGGDSHQEGARVLRKGQTVLLFLAAGTDEMQGYEILSGGTQSVWVVERGVARRLAPDDTGARPAFPLADAVAMARQA